MNVRRRDKVGRIRRSTAAMCALAMAATPLTQFARAVTNPGYGGTSISERDSVAVINAPGGLAVNTFIGHWSFAQNVLRIPGRGLPISFRMTYNSILQDDTGPLGNGWQHSYDLTCRGQKRVSGSTEFLDLVVAWGSGRNDLLVDTGSGYKPYNEGVFATLTEQSGNLIITTKEQIRFVFPKPAAGQTTRVTRILDPNSNALSISYNTQKRLSVVTDGSGRSISLTYNSRNQITQLTDANVSPARVAKFEYAGNDLVKYTDVAGSVTEYFCDSKHRMVKMADSTGITTVEYEPQFGPVMSITRSDLFGNVAARQTYVRDRLKHKFTATDWIDESHSASTFYEYDTKKRLVRVTDPLGRITKRTYDADGNVATVTDPLGHAIIYTYDSRGNVLTMKDALGNLTSLTYDPVFNRVTSMTDANGHTTTYGFDARGNLTSLTDALGKTTTYVRDAYGQTISRTNARNLTTTFAYSVNGDRVSTTDPLGRTTSATFDGSGRMSTVTDPKAQTTTFLRDARGRLLKSTFADMTAAEFAYDQNGHLLTASDPNTNIAWTYDSEGRMVSAVDLLRSKTIAYAYDLRSRRIGMSGPEGANVTYTYDLSGRLTAIDRGGDHFTFSYDAAGRRTNLGRPNGTSTAYVYDDADRLLSVTHTSSSALASFAYAYDSGSRRTKLTMGDGQVIDYSYDAKNQLTREVRTGGASNYDHLFQYDEVGNRISLNEDGLVTVSTYDDADQLIAQAGGHPATFAYDMNGCLVDKTEASGPSHFTYDVRDRMITAATPSGSGTYVMDAMGRRAAKTVGTATTQYVYDGRKAVAEYDGSGVLTALNLFGAGIDENLARYTGAAAYAYHHDGLGSVRVITNAAGAAVNRYDYDAWGNRSQRAAIPNDYTYTGRQKDDESGLYYYRSRQYDAGTSRFTQMDGVDEDTGGSAYVYANDDPVNNVDPLGLTEWDVTINKDGVKGKVTADDINKAIAQTDDRLKENSKKQDELEEQLDEAEKDPESTQGKLDRLNDRLKRAKDERDELIKDRKKLVEALANGKKNGKGENSS